MKLLPLFFALLVYGLPVHPARADAALAPALEAAWQRSSERLELEDMLELARVDQRIAARAWVQPPLLDLQRQHGGDKSETEVGLALPLWRAQQRRTQQAAADARVDWQAAAQAAARLELAAAVREAAWRVVQARMQQQWQQEQVDFLQRLQHDVARRVQAGDLAAIDATRAQARHLQAQVAREQSWQEWQQALSAWQVLTGLDAPPPLLASALPEGDATPAQPCHPLLCLAEWEITLAQRRSAAVDKDRPTPPALLLRLRQESGRGSRAGHDNSVRIGISIPLGMDGKHSAQRAAAALQIDDARVAHEKLLIRLHAAQAVARNNLQSARRQQQAAQARDALAQQQSAWLKTAFDAGQAALPEYLQALADAAEARADWLRQQAAAGLAYSRLRQALGYLP